MGTKITDTLSMLSQFILMICVFGSTTLFYLVVLPSSLMMLWNWLAPIFWNNAPHLTFFQSFGVWLFLNIVGISRSRLNKFIWNWK